MVIRQLHFVKSISVQGGGEAVAASKIARALAQVDVSITLVSRNVPVASPSKCVSGLKYCYLPIENNIFMDFWVVYRRVLNLIELERPHIIHIHGLWSPFLAVVALVACRQKIPLVISPHGCLESWALKSKRLKKMGALWLYQSLALRAASMFMVTSDSECQSVRRLGLKKPVAIIPIGVDVPDHIEASRKTDVQTFLFLSRIHPGKGLLDLVEAWAAVRRPGWRIVIAGGDEVGHRAQVENLILQKGLKADFSWIGFVDGEFKQACFAQADVFVLPTHSENFGIAIAEALAYGLPVITTTAAPWPGLLTHRCGWWVEIGVLGIAFALTQAMDCSPNELNAMGQRGRQWMAERFAWANIGADAALASAWLLDRSQPPPDFVDMGTSYN